ncbi:MAG: cyclic nucleotide-binding domain-containing protein [Steroidobacteraceae bacterium]
MSRPIPDLKLLRRACAPCTLRQFCQQSGSAPTELERDFAGQVQHLERGATLFRVGDAQGSVYIVRSGALKTTAFTEEGEEHVLGFHLPGELIGLDSLASGEHCVEAVALSETRVCAVPMQVLVTRGATTPGRTRDLLQIIGRDAQESQAHVEVLMRRQASERIALFLHSMLVRCQRHEAGLDELHLPMSREEVARYLGLALETVSRGFTRLQDEGVILVAGRVVGILDVERLRRLAQVPGTDHEPPLQRQA